MVRAAGPALAVVSQAVLILAGVTEGKRPFPGMVSLPGGTFRMGTERAAIDGLCRRFGTTHRDSHPAAGAGPHVGFRCAGPRMLARSGPGRP
jgi:formylglycine-generating enzyme required for sulfatase activity